MLLFCGIPKHIGGRLRRIGGSTPYRRTSRIHSHMHRKVPRRSDKRWKQTVSHGSSVQHMLYKAPHSRGTGVYTPRGFLRCNSYLRIRYRFGYTHYKRQCNSDIYLAYFSPYGFGRGWLTKKPVHTRSMHPVPAYRVKFCIRRQRKSTSLYQSSSTMY